MTIAPTRPPARCDLTSGDKDDVDAALTEAVSRASWAGSEKAGVVNGGVDDGDDIDDYDDEEEDADNSTDFDAASADWSESASCDSDGDTIESEDHEEGDRFATSSVVDPGGRVAAGAGMDDEGRPSAGGGTRGGGITRTRTGTSAVNGGEEESLGGKEVSSATPRALPKHQDVSGSAMFPSRTAYEEGNGGGEGDSAAEDDPFEPIPGEVKLVPSMFPDRPPTVFFDYPKELGMVRFDNNYYSEPLGGRRLLFKTHWERNSVKNAFFRAGFSRTRSTVTWTASWGKHPTREGFKSLNRFQKVNHFPGSWCIGRKDRLLRTLSKHKRELSGATSMATAAAAAAAAAAGTASVSTAGLAGKVANDTGALASRASAAECTPPNPLDFFPEGFVLPPGRRAWLKAVEAEPKAIWILKPPASSCGRGIRLVTRATAGSVSKSKKCLVQRYIQNPMLIDGRKFDLRLYVLVTSMEPLRVYLFEEGLVRLSTKRYTLKNLRSRYTHLTNYSINKKSGSFKAPEDSDGQEAAESTAASKWALTFFWKYLEQAVGREKTEQVKRSIEDVVLRTMAAADGDMTSHSHQATRHRGCCYELFGFDVLLDEYLKPWLLEVNISPSLFGSSALDRRIKGLLMADIFHLVGFRPFDRTALRREERIEARHIPGTRRTIRAVAGKPQDAWRKCQTPASVNLGELGEDEWEVIRDTEDEQHRAGHFRILYPTAENVSRLWSLFRSPRFLNGVLARWVLTGGLSNPGNRADIGLTAERLATLGGSVEPRKRSATGDAMRGDGACSARGRISRGSGTGSGEGRWEETTSNATTVISSGGYRSRPGESTGTSPWFAAAGVRPASSATSRASAQSFACRPVLRATLAAAGGSLTTTPAIIGAGSGKTSGEERDRIGSAPARDRRVEGAVPVDGTGARGAPGKKGGEEHLEVPRPRLKRIETRVIVSPGLIASKGSNLSVRPSSGGGNRGGGNRGGGNMHATKFPKTREIARLCSGAGLGRSAAMSTDLRSPRKGSSTLSGRIVDIEHPREQGRRLEDCKACSVKPISKVRINEAQELRKIYLPRGSVRVKASRFRDDTGLPVRECADFRTSVLAPISARGIPGSRAGSGMTACLPRPLRIVSRAGSACSNNTESLPPFGAALLASAPAGASVAGRSVVDDADFSSQSRRTRHGGVPDASARSSSARNPVPLFADSRTVEAGVHDSSSWLKSVRDREILQAMKR